jgi:mono/diheme cytochrome c family protein
MGRPFRARRSRGSLVIFSTFAIIAPLALAAGKWKVPASAEQRKSPYKADEKSVAAGKRVYAKECSECHGKSGKGDGPGAKDLLERPPDLGASEVQRQSDGALFHKLTTGNGEMPAYRKLLSEDERWHLVNYLRSFGATKSGAAADPSK